MHSHYILDKMRYRIDKKNNDKYIKLEYYESRPFFKLIFLI
jgi:hypothetical protein